MTGADFFDGRRRYIYDNLKLPGERIFALRSLVIKNFVVCAHV